MTPKQIKKAEEIWNKRARYFNQLFFGNANIREGTCGEDFRHQYVTVGDPVIVSSGSGEMRSGYIWKIMEFGGLGSGRNYFVFVPALGRVLVRASLYIARDISV